MIHDGEESLVLEKSLDKKRSISQHRHTFLEQHSWFIKLVWHPKCRSNLSHWISTIILPYGTRPWHRFLIEARATCLVAHLYTGSVLTIDGGRCTHTNHYRACWKSTVISAVMLSNIIALALTYLISWQNETMVRYSVLFYYVCVCVSQNGKKGKNKGIPPSSVGLTFNWFLVTWTMFAHSIMLVDQVLIPSNHLNNHSNNIITSYRLI